MAAFALSSGTLRLYIVEPQPLLARLLNRVLSDDGNVDIAGEAASFDAAAILKSRAEVVLVDCDDAGTDPAKCIRCWRSSLPSVRICILSAHSSPGAMMRAINAGADGYIIKETTPADLAACVRTVWSDGFYADPRLTSVLLRSRAGENSPHLSRRELDVVKLLADGLSNKQIAARLHLSDKTVRNHVANIFSKLDVSTRTQVAAYAIRSGIV